MPHHPMKHTLQWPMAMWSGPGRLIVWSHQADGILSACWVRKALPFSSGLRSQMKVMHLSKHTASLIVVEMNLQRTETVMHPELLDLET